MAEESQTILVDANRPKGLPVWLPEDSFFRQDFPDVEIILDTTQHAAAEYFRPRKTQIDYLHIDADHSFRACMSDFETYRNFMAENSLITLHDTNVAGVGVRRVVQCIRGMSDCEVVDFPEIGAGTAVVRLLTSRRRR